MVLNGVFQSNESSISDLHVTNDMVTQETVNMKVNNPCGPDEEPDDVYPHLLPYFSTKH